LAQEPDQESATPLPEHPVEARAAIVTRVVDGDTIHVRFSNGMSDKVRFIGVDTPESTIQHEPFGEEASAYTKQALAGERVFLQTDAERRDRYGRLLAYVWLAEPASGSTSEMRASLFNARLLLDGYATVLTIPPNVEYAEQFLRFQREARDADKGLWALPLTEEPQSRSAPDASGDGAPYIGNANTRKFHDAGCSSVDDMNPANRVPLATRAEAIERNFVPCKRCDP
jgi:micrococcal nuclease